MPNALEDGNGECKRCQLISRSLGPEDASERVPDSVTSHIAPCASHPAPRTLNLTPGMLVERSFWAIKRRIKTAPQLTPPLPARQYFLSLDNQASRHNHPQHGSLRVYSRLRRWVSLAYGNPVARRRTRRLAASLCAL